MAKTIIVPLSTHVLNGAVLIGYSASVIGPPHFSYGSDYKIDTGISVAANLTAWKNKIIAEVSNQGTTITGADIIVFGIPT